MSQAEKPNNMSRLSRRAALAGLTLASVGGAIMPAAAVPPVSEVDPIFAAIEAHKKLVEESLRLYGALDEAKGDASEKHGHRPCPLIMWRNYFIGDTEIDARRDALLQEAGADPEEIEKEYRDAKARERAAMERSIGAQRAAGMHMAEMKPKTAAGAGALVAYARADIEAGDCDWHLVALTTAADALAGMSSVPTVLPPETRTALSQEHQENQRTARE